MRIPSLSQVLFALLLALAIACAGCPSSRASVNCEDFCLPKGARYSYADTSELCSATATKCYCIFPMNGKDVVPLPAVDGGAK